MCPASESRRQFSPEKFPRASRRDISAQNKLASESLRLFCSEICPRHWRKHFLRLKNVRAAGAEAFWLFVSLRNLTFPVESYPPAPPFAQLCYLRLRFAHPSFLVFLHPSGVGIDAFRLSPNSGGKSVLNLLPF